MTVLFQVSAASSERHKGERKSRYLEAMANQKEEQPAEEEQEVSREGSKESVEIPELEANEELESGAEAEERALLQACNERKRSCEALKRRMDHLNRRARCVSRRPSAGPR